MTGKRPAPILSVRGLEKDYPTGGSLLRRNEPVRAVRGVDFDVFPGETLAIVGESGSGKSSIANAVLFLDPPTAGTVTFEGTELTRLSPRRMTAVRRRLQVVFQDPYASLDSRMRVGEIVAEPLRIHEPKLSAAQRRSRVEEMLGLVGLPRVDLGRYPHQFSGGQRQRISIARALILNPRLVVCDEAVSALDVSVQAQVLNLLDDLRQRLGLSYLFITHDLAVVRQIADRVLVLHEGKVVEQGNVDAVLDDPREEYTRRLISAVPGQRAERERAASQAGAA
ncbi:ATP-binding cassette domain-containing protein [Micromonospora sp. NPDC048830]|uniref:ATP-binding cassette domain-containing protein n=1 Tax=Micromonospora sp. NPDC048830 TaxID=3364257 RepID=UPI0037102842